jgi:hypothetical protein
MEVDYNNRASLFPPLSEYPKALEDKLIGAVFKFPIIINIGILPIGVYVVSPIPTGRAIAI